MRDDAAPAVADDIAPLDAAAVTEYLLDPANARGDQLPFDRVGDLFAGGDKGADEPPTPPAGLSDDELGELSGLVATLRLPEAMRLLDEDLVACFSPVAEHVSAGFQLHSCTSLDAPPPDSLTASCPADAPDALPAYDLTQHSVAPTPPTPTAAGRYTDGTADGGSALAKASQQTVLMLASPQQAGSPLAARGVQLALYRARWTLQDRVSPSWEVCALGGCEVRFAGDAPRTFSADDAPRAQGQPACLRSSSRLPRLPRDVAPPPSRPSTVRPRRRSSCPPPPLRGQTPLVHAAFYQSDHLALLHRADAGGTTLALRDYSDFDFVPLVADDAPGDLPRGGGAPVASLHARLMQMLASGNESASNSPSTQPRG